MLTGKGDLLESLIEAFLMEKGTREFYTQASAGAVNPEAKSMFEELSGWENRHMDYLQHLYLAIQEDRDTQGFEEFAKRAEAPFTESGIPLKEMEAKLPKYEVVDDRGAVELALEMEGKAYNLYRGLSERASDTNAKVLFREMIEQELGHIDYLKKLRARLAEAS